MRPAVVTALLSRAVCSAIEEGPVLEAELWRWPVTRRMQGLLAIAAATGGTARSTTGRCLKANCGERLEIPLDLELFRGPAAEDSFRWAGKKGSEFEVRVPSGEDQLLLMEDPSSDALVMARKLIRSGDPALLDADSLEEFEHALAEHDPLTDIHLTVNCPYCGAASEVAFDLELFLLNDLERRQMTLLETVHRLAMAYHWNEADVLALPDWRRKYYLDALEREGSV
jgi:hypothetical protein